MSLKTRRYKGGGIEKDILSIFDRYTGNSKIKELIIKIIFYYDKKNNRLQHSNLDYYINYYINHNLLEIIKHLFEEYKRQDRDLEYLKKNFYIDISMFYHYGLNLLYGDSEEFKEKLYDDLNKEYEENQINFIDNIVEKLNIIKDEKLVKEYEKNMTIYNIIDFLRSIRLICKDFNTKNIIIKILFYYIANKRKEKLEEFVLKYNHLDLKGLILLFEDIYIKYNNINIVERSEDFIHHFKTDVLITYFYGEDFIHNKDFRDEIDKLNFAQIKERCIKVVPETRVVGGSYRKQRIIKVIRKY